MDDVKPLAGLVYLAAGVDYQAGDDWAFECMKERCPAESFFCLLDSDCRSFVIALYVGVDGTGGGLCSRDLALEATCGSTCSRTTGPGCHQNTGPVVRAETAVGSPRLAKCQGTPRRPRSGPDRK